MGCCVGKDVPVVIKNDEGSTAPVRKRQCTDVLFLVLFIAALAGAGYIEVNGLVKGDPGRYIHGVDSWGNVCGRKTNKPILPSKMQANGASNNATNSGLDRSNQTYELNLGLSDLNLLLNPKQIMSTKVKPAIVCVHECPKSKVTKCSDLLSANGYEIDAEIANKRVCQMPGKNIYQHEALLNRCIPKLLTAIGDGVAKASLATAEAMSQTVDKNTTSAEGNIPQSPSQFARDFVFSISQNWRTIIYLLMIAFALSLVTIVLLQLFTRILVITIMVISSLGTGAVTAFLWYQYFVSAGIIQNSAAAVAISNITSTAEDILGTNGNAASEMATAAANLTTAISLENLVEGKYILPITIAVTVFTLISWLLLIWFRKSLKIVISLFDEASVALFSMPSLLFQPVITVIWVVAACAVFLVVAAFILTDQAPFVDTDGMVTFVDHPGARSAKVLLVPVVFVFLWLFQFIFACHEIILAGAVSSWFFTRNQAKPKCFDCLPLIKPTHDLICYNLGTAACGSLIIAIVQFIRLVLGYLQKKLKHAENKTAKYILKCMQCCLACFEKVLKYINRNAYICVAMYGESFCSSAKKALSLLVSNAEHVIPLKCIGGFCLFLGKAAVVAAVGAIGSVWFDSGMISDLKFLVPMLVTCIGAYCIVAAFMSVFGMAIDTIFLCFCDDHQRNNGSDRPYYSSMRLQKFMDNSKNESAKEPQPDSSAGPTANALLSGKKGKRSRESSKTDSPSFTRINIANRESLGRNKGLKNTRVRPLPVPTET